MIMKYFKNKQIINASLILAFLLLFLVSSSLTRGASDFFVEDFTTTTYRDVNFTDAYGWGQGHISSTIVKYNLTLLDTINPTGHTRGFDISGDLLYTASGAGGLQIIDIANPADLSFYSSYTISGYTTEVDVEGDIAYVAAGDAGLQIVNIADPLNPTNISALTNIGMSYFSHFPHL